MNGVTSGIEDEFCDPSITGLIFGFDREQCNKTLMDWASTSSSSVRAIIHYGQLVTSGRNKKRFITTYEYIEKGPITTW